MRDLIGRLAGRSNKLLPFEDVRRKLRATVNPRRRLRDIPLNAIVGSVGRATASVRWFSEALFFATYLALHWKQELAVLTVVEGGRTTDATLERARGYVETHGIEASYLIEHGAAGDAIVRAAEAHRSDVIVIGGYGFSPLLEIVLGSTVDQVLRASCRPVLICQQMRCVVALTPSPSPVATGEGRACRSGISPSPAAAGEGVGGEGQPTPHSKS